MKRITGIGILIFLQIVFFLLVVWIMLRPVKVSNQTIVREGTQGVQGTQGNIGYTPVKGIDYFDGQNGKDGTNGANGVDGFNVTPEQVSAAVESFCAAHNNCQGERGEDAPAPRTLQQRCIDGQVQQRYEGDDNWATLYYLPKGAHCV